MANDLITQMTSAVRQSVASMFLGSAATLASQLSGRKSLSLAFKANQAGTVLGVGETGLSILSGSPFIFNAAVARIGGTPIFVEGLETNTTLMTINGMLQNVSIVSPTLIFNVASGSPGGYALDYFAEDGSQTLALVQQSVSEYASGNFGNDLTINATNFAGNLGPDTALAIKFDEFNTAQLNVTIRLTLA